LTNNGKVEHGERVEKDLPNNGSKKQEEMTILIPGKADFKTKLTRRYRSLLVKNRDITNNVIMHFKQE
jgi:hypothetical protein